MNKEQKNWGVACHLSALLAITQIPLAHILGPLVIWLIKRDDCEFINDNGKEALNFQISMTIYGIVLFVLMLVTGIGSARVSFEFGVFPVLGLFSLLLVIGIVDLIFIIIAAVKSSNEEVYHYPLSIRFIK